MIWRSGSSISLYRGVSYETSEPAKKPYCSTQANEAGSFRNATCASPGVPMEMSRSREGLPAPVEKTQHNESPSEIKYETEMDNLLDSLGPRYADWPGPDPLPVDADMLPGIVHGYKPPFRILPYGVRSSLGYKEGTALRRLARVLPPHFALGKPTFIPIPILLLNSLCFLSASFSLHVGRSRQHQGLAAAMLKLWERSSIAKIALKRGVQLTTSERMAEDIKVTYTTDSC